MARWDVVLMVDEAQSPYSQFDFWVKCVKSQCTATGGPYIVLSSGPDGQLHSADYFEDATSRHLWLSLVSN